MKNLVHFIGLNKGPVDVAPSRGASVIYNSTVVEMETETHTNGAGMGIPHEQKISEEVRLNVSVLGQCSHYDCGQSTIKINQFSC